MFFFALTGRMEDFKESKIQNFYNHGATSIIYWVYYKLPILSYFEVGMYAPSFSFSDLLALFCYTQPTNTYMGIFFKLLCPVYTNLLFYIYRYSVLD